MSRMKEMEESKLRDDIEFKTTFIRLLKNLLKTAEKLDETFKDLNENAKKMEKDHTAMAQTLSSSRRWRCELSDPPAQSAPRPPESRPPCLLANRGHSEVVSKCSSDRKSYTPLTLNQKLEMIKFSEEGILKAEIIPKTRPLAPNSQDVNVKEEFLKEI
ncbi:hypothetical protein QTO34_006099 [Cnephaeus nilssonii]|uniref:HTH psq-type domain-containing protein n=1 Tax=Cnephaeus nilssonii TaxID=3371016 RepID=A0AA40HM53_CNENI|nr:hypothetical protein QTO34_006099 [Eptesicus nilssonii]